MQRIFLRVLLGLFAAMIMARSPAFAAPFVDVPSGTATDPDEATVAADAAAVAEGAAGAAVGGAAGAAAGTNLSGPVRLDPGDDSGPPPGATVDIGGVKAEITAYGAYVPGKGYYPYSKDPVTGKYVQAQGPPLPDPRTEYGCPGGMSCAGGKALLTPALEDKLRAAGRQDMIDALKADMEVMTDADGKFVGINAPLQTLIDINGGLLDGALADQKERLAKEKATDQEKLDQLAKDNAANNLADQLANAQNGMNEFGALGDGISDVWNNPDKDAQRKAFYENLNVVQDGDGFGNEDRKTGDDKNATAYGDKGLGGSTGGGSDVPNAPGRVLSGKDLSAGDKDRFYAAARNANEGFNNYDPSASPVDGRYDTMGQTVEGVQRKLDGQVSGDDTAYGNAIAAARDIWSRLTGTALKDHKDGNGFHRDGDAVETQWGDNPRKGLAELPLKKQVGTFGIETFALDNETKPCAERKNCT